MHEANDQPIQSLFYRRTGAIAAAIAITVGGPDELRDAPDLSRTPGPNTPCRITRLPPRGLRWTWPNRPLPSPSRTKGVLGPVFGGALSRRPFATPSPTPRGHRMSPSLQGWGLRRNRSSHAGFSDPWQRVVTARGGWEAPPRRRRPYRASYVGCRFRPRRPRRRGFTSGSSPVHRCTTPVAANAATTPPSMHAWSHDVMQQ